MVEFWDVITGTGDDPILDEYLCQTILIAAARREGLLNLRLGGIDREQCTLRLDEKLGKVVDQPVPDWFADELYRFAVARGATSSEDAVFRKRGKAGSNPQPITSRRLDYIFQRLQSACEWADKKQVTAHVLRHHAIAVAERSEYGGKAVSVAFARHEAEDTNGEYGKASEREVAQAVVWIHGGDHPLLHDAEGA